MCHSSHVSGLLHVCICISVVWDGSLARIKNVEFCCTAELSWILIQNYNMMYKEHTTQVYPYLLFHLQMTDVHFDFFCCLMIIVNIYLQAIWHGWQDIYCKSFSLSVVWSFPGMYLMKINLIYRNHNSWKWFSNMQRGWYAYPWTSKTSGKKSVDIM